MSLPILDARQSLLDAAARSRRILLEAPTGSGKSTQVPAMFRDAGADGQIIVLQPRRLAARLLAARVASERGAPLGGEVGYQIRMEDRTSRDTRIIYATEGILLRRMLSDPDLSGVSVLVFDEFHERHVYTDISLALALRVQKERRPDLLIVIMSATLDVGPLQKMLEPCEVVRAEGRMYPVEVSYLDRMPRDAEPWTLAAQALEKKWDKSEGHALVFMPGSFEIHRTIREVESRIRSARVVPLHGELPPDAQDAAVMPSRDRKIIVSTNVAETSLTIDGVDLVIDSGLARVARNDPSRGLNTLYIEKISRASADQRAGRAGRTRPGACLRLWTMEDHQKRPAHETPELLRVDLAEFLLLLRHFNIAGFHELTLLDHPSDEAVQKAAELLEELGATEAGKPGLTSTGLRMTHFPAHPRFARMFLAAEELGCVRFAAWTAAVTQTRNLLLPRRGRETRQAREDALGETTSDLLLLWRACRAAAANRFERAACDRLGIHGANARQALRLHEQFCQVAKNAGMNPDSGPVSEEAMARCVLAGFPDHVARRRGRGSAIFDLPGGRSGRLAEGSAASSADLVVALEVADIERSDGVQTQLSLACAIEQEWLEEMFPQSFSSTEEVIYDPHQKRVVIRTASTYRGLVLEEKRRDAPADARAAACLAREVISGRVALPTWDDTVEQWIARVNFLASTGICPGVEPIDDAARELLITQICEGATSARDLKERPVLPIVKTWLAAELWHQVEKLAPERLELPGGRKAKIRYDDPSAPRLSARIQDLYGVEGELRIAAGRVPLRIEILAPNHRPIQVTQNLSTFWAEIYPALKNQLQRRYPRHEWR